MSQSHHHTLIRNKVFENLRFTRIGDVVLGSRILARRFEKTQHAEMLDSLPPKTREKIEQDYRDKAHELTGIYVPADSKVEITMLGAWVAVEIFVPKAAWAE